MVSVVEPSKVSPPFGEVTTISVPSTVKLTGIVNGEFVAEVEVTVTVPV